MVECILDTDKTRVRFPGGLFNTSLSSPNMSNNYSEESKQRLLVANQKSIQTCKRLHQERIAEYNKNPKQCHFCGQNLEYAKRRLKYCNHSCSATCTNQKRSQTRKCLHCDNPTKNEKFCCYKCLAAFHSNEWKQKWLSNEIRPSNRFIGRELLKIRGSKCELCGIENRWNDKPLTLQVDHINGNAGDSRIENVRLICPNCHSQTQFYGSKNRGRGRQSLGLRGKENPRPIKDTTVPII